MKLAGKVRGALEANSRARELRGRRPPPMTVGPRGGGRPTIYYLTPDQSAPRGGVRMLYRHVELLTELGFSAAVMHSKPGFRVNWFEHATPVVSAGTTTLSPDDILVVPEFYAIGFSDLPREPRKIVFNQGAYHTFDHIPFAGTAPGEPYSSVSNLVAMLTVSEDSAALVSYTFPTIPVHRARAVLDRRVFHPGEYPATARQLAFVPRRRPTEREQLMHILRSRGVLDGWRLVPIEGYTETQTAQIMRETPIFFSFSEREGFGLPPVEAMASGCFVVGFTGLGGRDYFDPAYSAPVAEGDLLAYARAAEDAMRQFSTDPDGFAKAGRQASELVLGRYHVEGLRADLQTFYTPLISG
jgi:glycosyltransferase involved in cell wall biosynthesis